MEKLKKIKTRYFLNGLFTLLTALVGYLSHLENEKTSEVQMSVDRLEDAVITYILEMDSLDKRLTLIEKEH